MGIDEMLQAKEERDKRRELVREEQSAESRRLKEHEGRKESLRMACEARGEDFDAKLDEAKRVLTAMHKTGGLTIK